MNINTIKYQNIIRLKKLLSFRFVLVRHPETYASLHHLPKDLVKNRNHRLFRKPSTSIPAFSFACFFAQISRRIHRQRAYYITAQRTTQATCLLHNGLRGLQLLTQLSQRNRNIQQPTLHPQVPPHKYRYCEISGHQTTQLDKKFPPERWSFNKKRCFVGRGL